MAKHSLGEAMYGGILSKSVGFIILAVFLSFTDNSILFACDCNALKSAVDEYSEADKVFVGKVVGIDKQEFDHTYKIRFKVIKSYKGNLGAQFEIFSTLQPKSCDYLFEVDKDYLVYSNIFNNKPDASTCGRTRKLSEASEDLKVLNKIILTAN